MECKVSVKIIDILYGFFSSNDIMIMKKGQYKLSKKQGLAQLEFWCQNHEKTESGL